MSDFKTVLVRDSVIGDITSDIDFAVKSGASQTTYQRFPSTSNSNSSVIFNVQVPSENVVIGRDILINTGLTLQLLLGSETDATYQVAFGASAFDYGLTDSFQAFPLNSLFTTATAQINNTTVSINTKDVLPSLLRMNNSRELYRFNSTTPALPDQAYGVFAEGVNANNNPLASYATASYDLDQVPRGSFPANITILHKYTTGAGTFYETNVVGGTTVGGQAYTFSSSSNIGKGAAGGVNEDTWTILVQTVVSEPLFLAPFIFGDPHFNVQGLLGINNMSFTLNIDSTCGRVWSTANPYTTSVTLGSSVFGYANGFAVNGSGVVGLVGQQPSAPSLLFKFLSTQPSDLVQTKNIVPYMDFPRYLTNASNQPQIASLATATITSSNLQINQIPDLFIINIRKPMSQQTWEDTSSFLTINNISINLNNQSGLLSSASAYDLWRMSVKNGSTQSWAEFSGQANVGANVVAGVPTGTSSAIATTGSLLVINPAYDLSLPDYISCGSLGNYNFQFQVNASNQFPSTISPEIIVICVNSGIFTTQQGVSAVYTGILTKEMVLSAKATQQADAFHSQEIKRMTGGRMLDGALTAMKGMRRHMKGAGGSGGASSGGMGVSGGAKSRLSKMC
jgi:hypothetical protein